MLFYNIIYWPSHGSKCPMFWGFGYTLILWFCAVLYFLRGAVVVVLYDLVVLGFHGAFVDVEGLLVDVEFDGGVRYLFDFFLQLVDTLDLQITHLSHIRHAITPRLDSIGIPFLGLWRKTILISRRIQTLDHFQLLNIVSLFFGQVVLVKVKRLINLIHTVILDIL